MEDSVVSQPIKDVESKSSSLLDNKLPGVKISHDSNPKDELNATRISRTKTQEGRSVI